MSNSSASVAMIESHKQAPYGKASKEPKVDILESGFAKFCYRRDKTLFATFDAKNGGFRRSPVKRTGTSVFATIKLGK